MFELTKDEVNLMVSQFVIPDKQKLGGTLPFAFTEQGVAMLSSVLNSKLAIQINIQIIRVFTKMRHLLADTTNVRLEIAEIKQTVEKIARKQDGQDKSIELLFEYIDQLQEKHVAPVQERKSIGYKVGDKK